MKFGEKLKEKRLEAGLTQKELSQKVGIALRTVINYESGSRYPKKREVYKKLADLFSVDVNYFLTEDEEFILDASRQYGPRGARQAQELVEELTGLFAGGKIAPEDMEEMVHAIQEAYWIAKQNNKKYTPKKYREKKD